MKVGVFSPAKAEHVVSQKASQHTAVRGGIVGTGVTKETIAMSLIHNRNAILESIILTP
jgi:hypothetical protein